MPDLQHSVLTTMIQIPTLDLTVIGPMAVVFAWASVLLLIDLFVIPTDQKRITGYLAMIGLVVAAVVAFPVWGTQATFTSSVDHPHGMLVLDNYALVLTWIFLLVGLITIAISLDYLPRQGMEQGEFLAMILARYKDC